MNTQINIVKASGELADYDPEKLRHSLKRSGAGEKTIQNVLDAVGLKLYDGISTKKIYQLAFGLLKNKEKPVAGRYKLKRAIMELGPTGFPFEKFLGAILNHQDYRVKTGQIVNGHCVKHEIDVIAEKDKEHFMIECKFHNQPGVNCDVKIPLYIQSRFKDVELAWKEIPGHTEKFHQGWVVTNTRFTSDAIQYGNCIGLNLIGWDYPKNNSLNKQIDECGLYPVTCLTTLTTAEKQKLLAGMIVLCRELCEQPAMLHSIQVPEARHKMILQEAKELCKGKHA